MSCCMCCTGGTTTLSCCCCFCVPQANVAVVQNCGKFEGLATPGLHCVDPCRVNVAGTVSLRAQTYTLSVESKTKENVFVKLDLQIFYQVLPGAIDVAFYYLQSPTTQIGVYVCNYIRATIPSYTLEELYLERSTIAAHIKTNVDDKMDEFGFDILNVLITNIEPDAGIRKIMNDLLASRRLQVAESDSVAADCIIRIKRAEANAELQRLSAIGVANQRREVLKGFEFSIDAMREALPSYSTQQLLHVLLTTQYMDTMKEVAAQGAVANRGGHGSTNPNSNTTTSSQMKTMAMSQLDAINHRINELNTHMLSALRQQPVPQYSVFQQLQQELMVAKAQKESYEKAVAEEQNAAQAYKLSNANEDFKIRIIAPAVPEDENSSVADKQDVLYMPHVSALSQVADQLLSAASNAVPEEAKRSTAAAMLLAQRKGASMK